MQEQTMSVRAHHAKYLAACCALALFGCAPAQPPAAPDTRAADEAAN